MLQLTPPRRILLWTLLGLLTMLLCYGGLRGHLNAELLMYFANAFYC